MNTYEIFNSDCFEQFKQIPSDSIDAIITDPPYAINYSNTHSKDAHEWDDMTDAAYEELTKSWLAEAKRVLKDDGSIWFFFAPTKIRSVLNAIDSSGLIPHLENWSIYARSKGRGAKAKLKSLREDIMHLTKTDKYQWNSVEYLRRVVTPYRVNGQPRGWDFLDGEPFRMTGLGNVMAFNNQPVLLEGAPRGHVLDIASGESLCFDGEPSDVNFFTPPYYLNKLEPQQHSAQKPVLLLSMLMMLVTEQNDTVLDPFMGSGSSGIASLVCDRNFIGIERETETFSKAEKWLANLDKPSFEKLVAKHISSSEKGFKFGFGQRDFMRK